jgi:hypothetical protein
MKTTFTKLVVCFSLFASPLARAQAPLLPLFEDNTFRWTTNWYAKNGGLCPGGDKVDYYNEIIGDTMITGQSFKVVLRFSKRVTSCSSLVYDSVTGRIVPVFVTYQSVEKKYLQQFGNVFVYANSNGIKDTATIFKGTELGDMVLQKDLNGSYDTTFILKIDSIAFEGRNIMLLKIGKKRVGFNTSEVFYMDGIGFAHTGADTYFSYTNTHIFEASSILTCFSKAGNVYEIQWGADTTDTNRKPTALIAQTGICGNPLSIEPKVRDAENIHVILNSQKHLITTKPATEIDIYDSMSRRVLQNKNSDQTDVSSLKTGVYIANISFANNRAIKYRFAVQE